MVSRLALIAVVLGVVCAPGDAVALPDFPEGSWRLELRGMGGIHQGSMDRTGDWFSMLGVGYEVPVSPRNALELRLLPLFVYEADDAEDTVYGAGLGVAMRTYLRREMYAGWFIEGEANMLLHEERIPGNTSNLNFLLGFGLGYQFGAHWSATLRYQHISNASLGARNSGANGVGLALGYRF